MLHVKSRQPEGFPCFSYGLVRLYPGPCLDVSTTGHMLNASKLTFLEIPASMVT